MSQKQVHVITSTNEVEGGYIFACVCMYLSVIMLW